jgi:hypothetical protein
MDFSEHRINKSERLRWAGHVARIGNRKSIPNFDGKRVIKEERDEFRG